VDSGYIRSRILGRIRWKGCWIFEDSGRFGGVGWIAGRGFED